MAGQSNAAPVIIKRKKVVQGGGHHGGAWKVAYADFVTAMMAFFLLMWLLNASTEKQRKGLADYFNPTIPINRISGGGEGALSGNSIFTEEENAHNGTGASDRHPTVANQARGATKAEADAQIALAQAEIEQVLTAYGGESMTMERALRHIATKVTEEGLVVEIFDLPESALFEADTAVPEQITQDIAKMLAEVLALVSNALAVNAHVRSYPLMMINNPVWPLTAERSQVFRKLLEGSGLPAIRVQRVSGFADRKPVTANPVAMRNNRIEVILLRRDR